VEWLISNFWKRDDLLVWVIRQKNLTNQKSMMTASDWPD